MTSATGIPLNLSPIAVQVPGVRDPALGRRRAPWGFLLHTTGGGVTDLAKRKHERPIDVAIQTYINSQNGSNGYFWGGPGYVIDHDGSIHQVAPDDVLTAHAGSSNRPRYIDGSWATSCPATAVAEWRSKWPTYRHPYSLFPTESPNLDYCLDATMRVLTADLRWIPIGDIAVGQRLVGFGEELIPHNTIFPCDVLYSSRVRKQRVRVVTTHGNIVCSDDHMFVGKLGQGGSAEWLRANQLRVGSRLRHYTTPWDTDTTNDGGWLAGMIDGEGNWSKSGELIVSQNPGPVLDRLLAVLAAKGIEFNVRGRDKDECRQVSLQGGGTGIAHVGRFRPSRMLAKAESRWDGRRVYGSRTEKPVVLAVERLEDGEVVAIKTTSRTFIAEGFLSHNCGCEMIPIGDGFGGEPMAPGLRFTRAQHESALALAIDVGNRHGFPDGWRSTSRLLGHEDVDPLARSDAGGGWDPGFLRAVPYFDLAFVRA